MSAKHHGENIRDLSNCNEDDDVNFSSIFQPMIYLLIDCLNLSALSSMYYVNPYL